ncbi:hypothetical protein ABZP36_003240 [Zizania latifolia]
MKPSQIPKQSVSASSSSSPRLASAYPMDTARHNLNANVLRRIHRSLSCLVDRHRMGQVCRAWRAAVAPQQHPPQRPLPWILVPSADGPSFSCALGGCATHDFRVPLDGLEARYFGAYDGGWLFAAFGQTYDHAIVNLRTKNAFEIPDYTDRRAPGKFADKDIVMLATTLSSPPEHEDCIGAAIISFWPPKVDPHAHVFWRMGHRAAAVMPTATDQGIGGTALQDVIHHNGAFYFLTRQENLHVFAVSEFHQDDDGELKMAPMKIRWLNGAHDYRSNVVVRYLVESRGRLLMVARLVHYPLPVPPKTWAFRVFEMVELPQEDVTGSEETQYAWNELASLDGRILFLARGCSRCYEVADYPGLEFSDGIYFLDDGRLHDDGKMLRNATYPCIDSGKWLAAANAVPRVDNFLPEQRPSKYSPPAWLLP